jgi:2-dehydro-3-deoxy-D-arabinonate dehydratase
LRSALPTADCVPAHPGTDAVAAVWRIQTAEGERLARGTPAAGATELLDRDATLDKLLAAGGLDADAAGPQDFPAGVVLLTKVV